MCSKDFYKVSNRLQRLKLKLLQYNFNTEYLPGKYMCIADLLSRSFFKTEIKHTEQPIVVHSVDIELPISDSSLNNLKNATINDPILKQVQNFCSFGWPEKCKKFLHTELSMFFKLRDSLFVKDN